MGKGSVTDALDGGEYDIQLLYDRETFDRRIGQLNDKIADIDLRLSEIDDALEYGSRNYGPF